MVTNSPSSKEKKIKNLTWAETARLAGAIWIYGSIHVAGSEPRIVITMPIPLVYQYKQDFGGSPHRGNDGYFTLQITGPKLVKKRLKEIQPFMSGEEAIQIGLALEIIHTKESSLTPEKKKAKLTELIEDWNRSKNRLKQWMEDFVESHKDERKTRIPVRIWNKAYDWSRFMKESGYDKIPRMVAKEESRSHAQDR